MKVNVMAAMTMTGAMQVMVVMVAMVVMLHIQMRRR